MPEHPNISLQSENSLNAGSTASNPRQTDTGKIHIQTTDSISGRFLTTEKSEPVRFNPEPIPKLQNEWQVLVLSFSVLIIAFVRISGRNFFKNLYSGLTSRPIFRQLLRDGQLIPQAGRIPLLLAFLLVITVFIFQLDHRFQFISFPAGTLTFRILVVIALLAIFEIVRYIIMQMLGFIFKIKEVVREFITNNIFFNTLSTLLILPLLMLQVYSRSYLILYLTAGILISLFIFRLTRGMLIAFELRTYSGYQIFLYLCALEILPVFMLIKILTEYFSSI